VEYADLVFTGGPVFTANTVRSRTDAVAVRDGRIIAVGSSDVAELVGPATEVVDLGGGLLIPGFQDAHIHPVGGGMELLRCNLADSHSVSDYEAVIAAYAAAHREEEWILGGGWAMAAFPGGTPTAATLDALVPDRPVFLPNRDHHSAWVNSFALAAAGITRDTPDPEDGRIERDADGNPSGVLHEGAMSLVERLIPEPPPNRSSKACWPGRLTCTRWASPAGKTRSSGCTAAFPMPARPICRWRGTDA
jgi:predicted amidohydrolase YtcJ